MVLGVSKQFFFKMYNCHVDEKKIRLRFITSGNIFLKVLQQQNQCFSCMIGLLRKRENPLYL